MKRFASVVICALLPPAAVLAQSDSQTLAALRDCGQIESDVRRLACFDGALAPAARGSEPAPRPPAPTVETERPDAERPASASARNPAAPPTPAAPSRGTERDAPTRTLVIVDVREVRNGTLFVADDGRQWVQTSGIRSGYPPVPFEAALRPGALSGSLLEFGDGSRRGRSIRVTLRE